MISSKDKDAVRAALTTAFNDFISTFGQFDSDTINQKPGDSHWTPGQVVQHILLATDGVPDGRTGALKSHRKDSHYDSLLEMIRPWWEDLNQKFQSPQELRPDSDSKDKGKLLSALQDNLRKDLSIVDSADLSDICLDFELPSVGYLTRY